MTRIVIRSFQDRCLEWANACFGPFSAARKTERNERFLEEALELVQATGLPSDQAHALVDYVYTRPVGEPDQELGGVMNTLALLAAANGLDMDQAGKRELDRVNTPEVMEKIRKKQAGKPKGSALPQHTNIAAELAYLRFFYTVADFGPAHADVIAGINAEYDQPIPEGYHCE